ncbi:MAG TPA: PKD domain-containing protein [Bacteroidales bacterium]|nr:PKD domain-containing protein [Bacteroidales bacterium]HSA43362.1 PKD domain-containing protein [Bacteroidales bacterium]
MKKWHRMAVGLLSCTFIIILITKTTHSQALVSNDTADYPYWIGMMQDEKVNFFEVQRAFEAYWKDRPVTRSSGWKPFKRWEYMMGLRVSETGERPAAERNKKAYETHIAQKGPKENAGTWTELGPRFLPVDAPGLGRLNAIAFHPVNPDILWVGAPSGGLWKSTNGGQFWTSNTDELPTLGVSAIIVDYTNPDIIYIGTGDRDAGDAPGFGVMKSVDGGQSWFSSNNGMGNVTVGKMLIHPQNPQILYAATSNGVYKSNDAGNTWFYSSPNNGHFKDMVFKPGDPSTLYATRNGLLYKSENDAVSWVPLTNGLPGAARGVIGVSPANPEVVYFLAGNSDSYRGIYYSEDGGASFTEQSDSPNILSWGCNGGNGGQAWYDLCVAVDPLNPDVVYAGGVNIFKSTDRGQSWFIVAHWWGDCDVAFAHADQHVFEWHPLNNRLYAGNDGGCYYTEDGGNEWVQISQGLAIAQVYKIGQSATEPDLVINGYQDNGSAVLSDTTWYNVLGADGMECAIDPVLPLYKYGTYYYGSLHRLYGFTHQGVIAANGENGINESGAWVSPFIIHESDPNTIFLGMKSVWRSNNVRNLSTSSVTWTKISGNFGAGDCRALEQSPANPDILYLIKDNGKIYRTDQANAATPAWTDLSPGLPVSLNNPSDIEAHPLNENWAYLTSNGKVYKTTDKGMSWTDFSGSLPDVFYSSIAYSIGSLEGLYLGSDIGVFYRDASMNDWMVFSNGLPANGRVTEVEIYSDPLQPANNRVRACTYGRGLWESPLYQSQPLAQFTADATAMPSGCPINFTDLSVGFPTSWQWTFYGGNPGNSSVQNPSGITYPTAGAYDVRLVVTNSIGSDTLLLPAYIVISDTILPKPGFYVNDSIFCSGIQTVTFFDSSQYCPVSWLWSFNPPDVVFLNGTSATSQNPVVQFTQDGQYTVSLTVGNVNGSIGLTKTGFIRIGGLPLPFQDDFESAGLKHKAWTIENPNNDLTWDVTTTGGNPPGSFSARMRIFGTNSMGRRDRLITPPLDLNGMDHAALFFKHAYCQYQTEYSDSLVIWISEDCGNSWTRLYTAYEDGNGSFATHAPQTFSFTPASAADWCDGGFGSPCFVFDLTAYTGKKNIRIAFESVSFMSNNIFLDDINIAASNSIREISGNSQLRVYPNPALHQMMVESSKPIHKLLIYNAMGNVVLTRESHEKTIRLDVSSLESGVYGLTIFNDDGVFSRLVVVGR